MAIDAVRPVSPACGDRSIWGIWRFPRSPPSCKTASTSCLARSPVAQNAPPLSAEPSARKLTGPHRPVSQVTALTTPSGLPGPPAMKRGRCGARAIISGPLPKPPQFRKRLGGCQRHELIGGECAADVVAPHHDESAVCASARPPPPGRIDQVPRQQSRMRCLGIAVPDNNDLGAVFRLTERTRHRADTGKQRLVGQRRRVEDAAEIASQPNRGGLSLRGAGDCAEYQWSPRCGQDSGRGIQRGVEFRCPAVDPGGRTRRVSLAEQQWPGQRARIVDYGDAAVSDRRPEVVARASAVSADNRRSSRS